MRAQVCLFVLMFALPCCVSVLFYLAFFVYYSNKQTDLLDYVTVMIDFVCLDSRSVGYVFRARRPVRKSVYQHDSSV